MIDTHAHVDVSAFDDDRIEVLKRARTAGVEAIIIPAITIEQTAIAEQLVTEFPWIYRAVGIHPHYASSATVSQLEFVENQSSAPNVVAIGEIGLDYYYDYASPEQQRYAFREQLRIAKRTGLPVIVHNREADNDILELLEQEQDGTLRGVLHCFSSPPHVLERALQLGFHVSFTGNITFRRWSNDDILRMVPFDRFMIETDSPYMTPEPYRGKRNEPAFVRFVAERLAAIRQTTFEDIVMSTTRTAKRLFNLAMISTILVLMTAASVAQSSHEEESDTGEFEYIHPYPRSVGFGGLVGPNTIVETQTLKALNRTQPLSFEGIPAYGMLVVWELTDRLMIEAAYAYSLNRKVVYDPQTNPFGQANPDSYHFLEIGARWMLNPYSRVVFYGFGGVGSVWISRDGSPLSAPKLCVTPGLGLFVNIPTPIGMLAPGGEWRLNFMLADEQRFVTMANGERYMATISTFFSIPRFTLLYFPRW